MPRDRKQKLSEGDKAIVAKAGVDNTARRTWDKDEFADKAAAREKKASSCHDNACKGWTAAASGSSDASRCAPQEEEDEESALDVKKRRRLGEYHSRYCLTVGRCNVLQLC